jgi:hypothetical protein
MENETKHFALTLAFSTGLSKPYLKKENYVQKKPPSHPSNNETKKIR